MNASGSSQGVAGWEHQSYSKSDLKHFQEHYDIPLNPIRKIYGHNTGLAHMESNLDTQTITSIATGAATDFFLNGGLLDFDVLDWAYQISNETDPALVWSVSYGEDMTMKSVAHAQAADEVFQKLVRARYRRILD